MKFYITTPIYYINAKPHIGHAYSTVSADVLARFHRLKGDTTFFLTGTDEHGEKNEEIAKKMKMLPQKYADKMSAFFELTWDNLNISHDNFIRTTSPKHKKAVQKALQILFDKGYIYPGEHSGLYCKGCEQYLTEKDLIDGKCPDHNTRPVLTKEKSYMFKLSAFSEKLKKIIEKDELVIEPRSKKNEILAFYKQGLKDISFSRSNTSWGVKLPWDKSQVAYVWPDAFLNYLTGIGWEGNPSRIPQMWPAEAHLMSKDILRVHATIWPAMLLALGLPLPKKLFIHGFFLVEGKKMSKSVGNVISPDDLIKKYGADGTRYLLISAAPFGYDGDISLEKFNKKYNADLANGLGNLVSRSLALFAKMKKAGIQLEKTEGKVEKVNNQTFNHNMERTWKLYETYLEEFKIDKALSLIFGLASNEKKISIINFLDNYITLTRPWELISQKDAKTGKIMYNILERLRQGALMLWPFIPETADKIMEGLGLDLSQEKKKSFKELKKWGRLPKNIKTKKIDILFPRIKK